MKNKINPQSILRIASKFERLVAESDEEIGQEHDSKEQKPTKTLPIDDWNALNKCSDSNDLFIEFKESVINELSLARRKLLMLQNSYEKELASVNFQPVFRALGKAIEIASGKYHAGLLQRIGAMMDLKLESQEYRDLNVFWATRQLLNKIEVTLEDKLNSAYVEQSNIESMKRAIEIANRFADSAKSRLEDAKSSYVGSIKSVL